MTFSEFRAQFEASGSRVIMLAPLGRAGVFFLQSLFDSHPEVLMYPGNLDFYNRVVLAEGDWKQGWRQRLVHTVDAIPQAVHMNINKGLGVDGRGELNLDAEAIVAHTEQLLAENFTSRDLFLAVHYAIGCFLKRDLTRIRCILIHDHHTPMSGDMEDAIRADFPNTLFIYTTRDPRSNYLAQRKVKEVLMGREGFEFKYENFMTLTCIGYYEYGLSMLERFAGDTLVVRLEDIQAQREIYIRALAKRVGIAFDPCLLHTTFGGMEWGGDAASAKREPGFRNSADPKKWMQALHPIRVAALEAVLGEEIQALGYPRLYTSTSLQRWLALALLPLWKYEDFDKLLNRSYFAFRRSQNLHWWKVWLRDGMGFARATLGLGRRLFFSARSYPKVPAVVFHPPRQTV